LLELVLVVTIVAMLAVIAYPSLTSMYSDLKMTQAADQVRAAWALGRAHALNEARPYRFAIMPDQGNYRIAPDSGDFWSGNGSSPAAQGGEKPLILEESLPRGIRFVMSDAPVNAAPGGEPAMVPEASAPSGQYLPIATFLPDGTCREDVNIVLTMPGVRPLIMKLRGITGAVTVRPMNEP
jgi:type II secretory pathway pseudopilin PulG